MQNASERNRPVRRGVESGTHSPSRELMSHCIQRYLLLAFAGALAQPAAAASQWTGPSDTAFVLARAGVVPENMVYDAPRHRFLGGNLERDGMVELGRDGSVRRFAEAAGLEGRVLGLKI